MNYHISDTAILVFTRSLESECKHKKLAVHHNERIVQKLISETEALVKESGIPYFISSDEHQYGRCFGERLFNEMWRVFNEGYEKIIVIGNDSPGLETETLVDVSMEIKEGKLILGPSEDGGIYLLGIHRNNLDRDLFIHLPWLSDRVYNSFVQYASGLGVGFRNLEKLHDIDNGNDLQLFLKNQPLHKFSLWVNSLFTSDNQKKSDTTERESSFEIIGFKQMRAPPSWAN